MQQTNIVTNAPLHKLGDTDLVLADLRQDIRGRSVIDQDGKPVGHVRMLFIDAAERKVQMIGIAGGGFLGVGDQHFLLPVTAVTKVDEKVVHVNETAARIKNSPAYDPKLETVFEPSYWGPYYGYYGRSRYWDNNYHYPNYESWYI